MSSTNTSMHGKTALVTGASTGIGYATAAGLARAGATVLVHGRSQARADDAVQRLRADVPQGAFMPVIGDLAVQAEVRALAQHVLAITSRLDVLVNNAAIVPPTRTVTPDGIETQLAVNHLAPFLLTNLLLERLKASAPARIVTVASSAHTDAKLDWDDLQNARYYHQPGYPLPGYGAYARTKLYNILFTRALAARLEGTGVTANALHPGVIATDFTRSVPRLFNWVYRRVMPGPEVGARTSLYLATSPEVARTSGAYYDAKQRRATPTPDAQNDAYAERLWAVSVQMTGLAEAVPARA